jgi:hypothetical protein
MKKPRKKKSGPAKPETPPKVEVIEPARRPGRKKKPIIEQGLGKEREDRKASTVLDLRPAVTTRERGLVPYDPSRCT